METSGRLSTHSCRRASEPGPALSGRVSGRPPPASLPPFCHLGQVALTHPLSWCWGWGPSRGRSGLGARGGGGALPSLPCCCGKWSARPFSAGGVSEAPLGHEVTGPGVRGARGRTGHRGWQPLAGTCCLSLPSTHLVPNVGRGGEGEAASVGPSGRPPLWAAAETPRGTQPWPLPQPCLVLGIGRLLGSEGP